MSEVKPVEHVAVADLKPHPRNYKKHPDDQLVHIIKSIEEHGFYRNVVVARDNTILAGHGVVEAVRRMGLFGPERIPVIRIDVDSDDPRALKIMTSDNELGKFAEVDDSLLISLLNDVKADGELLGTGFDDLSLNALIYVTRPPGSFSKVDEAEEWARLGMPDFVPTEYPVKLMISFDDEAGRVAIMKLIGALDENEKPTCNIYRRDTPTSKTWCVRWPLREKVDNSSVRFELFPELEDAS